MAKTGPQKYPPASLSYWWQNAFPGNAMESNVGVIHVTEGRTVPDYRGGRDAPNFTALPDIPNKKLRWFQHFDFDTSSRALMNLAGGVETNTANAVQVELVGTCDERNAVTWGGKRAGVDYIFWPDAPDWALAELGEFVRWASDNHRVPMQSTVTWKAYKKGQVGGSYGANGVRLTGTQWGAYYGWLGHQHVPENDHGDPGNINFARVLEHARGDATTQQEDIVTPAEIEAIASAVWNHKIPNVTAAGVEDGTTKEAYWVLSWMDYAHAQTMKAIAESKLTPAQIAAAVANGTLKVVVTVAPSATPNGS
ncbi:hypothetical protein ACFV0B_11525 [Streptomyces xanthophaeus]|uniref:hypothetical protein n=1 Tax=Streptomyces xanthophaeus TaxID=67385 RepID=UPI003684444D